MANWAIHALFFSLLLGITIRPNNSATTTINSTPLATTMEVMIPTGNVTTQTTAGPSTDTTTASPVNSTTTQTNITTLATLVNGTATTAALVNGTTTAALVNGTTAAAQSTAGPTTNTTGGKVMVTNTTLTYDLATSGVVISFEAISLSTANGTIVFRNVTVSTADGTVVIGHVIVSQQTDTTTTTTTTTTTAPACTTSKIIPLVVAAGGGREDTTCSGILGVICLLFGLTVIVFVVRFRQPLCHRQDCFRTTVNEDVPPSCVCGRCVCGLYRPDSVTYSADSDKTKMSSLANEDQEIGGGGGIPMKLLQSHGPRRSLADDKAPLEAHYYNRGFSGGGDGGHHASGSESDGHHHHPHHQGQPSTRKTSRDDADHSNGSGPHHAEGSKSYRL